MKRNHYEVSFELSLASTIILLLWISIAVVGRIIPHLPNATPLCALSVLSGYAFRKNVAVFITLISLILSDIILGYIQQTPIFGSWSFFTYSGFLMVTLFAPENSPKMKKYSMWIYLLASTVAYWLWSNFGSWIATDLYAHNLKGLFTCFIAGLPFLRNAVLGSIVYMLIFFPTLNQLMTSKIFLRINRFTAFT